MCALMHVCTQQDVLLRCAPAILCTGLPCLRDAFPESVAVCAAQLLNNKVLLASAKGSCAGGESVLIGCELKLSTLGEGANKNVDATHATGT